MIIATTVVVFRPTKKYLESSEFVRMGENLSRINTPLTNINNTNGKSNAERRISSSLDLVLLANLSTRLNTIFLITNNTLTQRKYITGAYIKVGIAILNKVISFIIYSPR